MSKVIAGITTSIDGYVAGPDDGPEKGLGEGGERLHYWVFGGPWSYENEPRGEPSGPDADWLNEVTSRIGASIGGRWTYEAARHWGDKNPSELPFFILTHRPEEQQSARRSTRGSSTSCRSSSRRSPSAAASACSTASRSRSTSSTSGCASPSTRPSSTTA